ncbi:MAG: chromosome segregation protein [Clostridia bacterium]|jgi:chromosome segregation protein|nr:chromosome segregation protein [Clostridiales bacterium]MDK2984742.1 chromosome segregation protein [Clostridia bacterium]
MYLQRLQINGFKSFVDKTNINLGPGITCIVGPNGSGKSNIADAMRWVLGEQSVKSLRGSKMEDVIFAGSKNRKPVGRAEVSITLDNSGKMFPLDYSEITVTRRVFRSGESQYLINKVPSRLKDVHELFMDTGVGKEAFAIIGQGKVDWIVGSTPEERRPLFEEVAGITKYRYRKKEALKKLENTKDNLTRINDILTELEDQLKPLSDEAKKAEIYLDKKRELTSKEIGVQLKFITEAKKDLENVNLTLKKLEMNFSVEQVQENIFKSFYERLKLTKIKNQERISSISKLIQNLEEEKHSATSEKLVTQEQVRGLETQLESFQNDLQNKEKELHNLETQLQEKQGKLHQCQLKIAKVRDNLKMLNLEFEELERKMHESEEELNRINSSQIEELNNLSSLKTDLANYSQRKNIVEKQYYKNGEIQENRLAYLKTLKSQIEEKLKYRQDLENALREINSQVNSIQKEKEQVHNEISKALKEKEKYSENLYKIRSRYRVIKEMHSSMEGYYKGVKSILTAKKNGHPACSGVLGVVAEILGVPEQYEVAIETALGGSLQNLVTSTDEDAKKAISYLKMISGGRATFLPLNSLQFKTLKNKEYFSRFDGVVGMASDLVTYDKIFEPVVIYLLGRVIVTEDVDKGLQVARGTSFNFKIVTLEGEIFHPGGSISGGGTKQNKSGLLGRSRQLQNLKKQEEEAKEKYSATCNKISQLEQQVVNLNCKEKNLLNKKEEIKYKIVEIKQEVESEFNKKKELERELEVLKIEQQQMSQEIKEIEEKQNEISDKLQEKQQLQQSSQELLDKLRLQNKEYGLQKEKLSSTISQVKIEMGTLLEQEAGLQNFIEDLQGRIEDLKANKSNTEKQIENVIQKKHSALQKANELQKQLSELDARKKNKDSLLAKLVKLNNKLQAQENTLSNILDNVSKKLQLLKYEIHKNEVEKTRLESGINGVVSNLTEQFEVSLEEINNYQLPDDINKVKRDISRLKREIASLGEVNVGAIEQYKKIKKRYSFLSKQRADLLKASDELKQVISQVDSIMVECFQETFSKVNKYFSEIFRFLFNGGSAHLSYSDESNPLETGINIQAQPPGKKLQNLSLLSGGERALTAIALLFAFLKVKPSPFCILDEIEASLDEANVRRFAEFLHNFSQQTQFLVITHRQPTMELADILYGVTMEEPGVSKLISVKLDEVNIAGSA